MQFADWNLQSSVRLATLNAARVAGLSGRGRIEAGSKADIVVLNSAGEVQNTIVGGAVVGATRAN